ncbi:chaplin [Streptomyces sp. NPDC003077]|uniref:chaplin n=1 Tax=Streptomyces sp. NPDC003077 TaxID=3154443 RepID=UPI0033B88007
MKYAKFAAVAAGTLMTAGSAAAPAFASADTQGAATNSPGIISGNTVQMPIHLPIVLCNNTIDIIGLLNPAFGNACETH